jgi:hypothetical protein
MQALTMPLKAVVDPVGTIPRAVEQRRWLAPLLLLSLFTALSGVAVASRVDASRIVLPEMERTGELAKATEREVAEAIEQAQRVAIVGSVAKGVFVTPLAVLLLAVALEVTAWLVGRKAPFSACFTAAALSLLPVALFHAIEFVSVLRQDTLSPKMAELLVPSSLAAFTTGGPPRLERVFRAIDVINVWSALLLGVGFSAATKWSPWKGALLGLFLYVLFAGAFLIGVPGLMAGGAGGPGLGGQ